LAACSSGQGRRDLHGIPSQSFGKIQVTLTVPRSGAPAISARARLLGFRDLDLETAGILSGMTHRDRQAAGQCVRVDGEALLDDALGRASPDADVRMLDAGEMSLRVAGRTMAIIPRYAPEIVPFVNGVVYEADPWDDAAGLADPASSGDAYISAFGGEDVGHFDVMFR
jgi:hypothetical protein